MVIAPNVTFSKLYAFIINILDLEKKSTFSYNVKLDIKFKKRFFSKKSLPLFRVSFASD